MIVSLHGGQNEKRQNRNTVACKINYFLSYELDIFFLATISPGRSAFKCLGQRMTPLRKDFTGVLLDHFESHLDDKGYTTDAEIELLMLLSLQVKFWRKCGIVWFLIWEVSSCDGICYLGNNMKCEVVAEDWKLIHIWPSHAITWPSCIICKSQRFFMLPLFKSWYPKAVSERFLPRLSEASLSPEKGAGWVQSEQTRQYLSLHKQYPWRCWCFNSFILKFPLKFR